MESEVNLTVKQRRFIEAYVGEAKFNATKAARLAGYSERSAPDLGSRQLANKQVMDAINARLSQMAVASGEVLKRLGEIARNEAAEYIVCPEDPDLKPYVDLVAMQRDGKLHLVRGLEYSRSGDLVVKLMDAQAALELLARHHGLLKDKVEVSGPDGGPVPLALGLFSNLTAEELQRRLVEARADLAAAGCEMPALPGS